MRKCLPVDTDAYKIVHHLQRPKGINKLISYGEPRIGGLNPEVCFFGLQAIVQESFLSPVTNEMIEEAVEECISTFGTDKFFNKQVWERVRDLGYLPIRIMSAPEGTIIPEGNVCFTIESTEDWFADMISHFEDDLMHVWYPTSVSTRSMNIKRNIIPAFKKSSDIMELVLPVAVNDFGLRGATMSEGAIMGGMGHLLHFDGSDNLPASRMIKDFYGYKGKAKSVWATEHSVATCYGPGRGEYEYVIAQLSQHTDMIKSIVIDSYDADNFMQNIVGSEEIKALVKAHKGRIVWRPDSGKPLTNVCKYSDVLGAIYGFSLNNKGYKIINDNQGLIQGDGMTEQSIPELYNEYIKTGWAADNIITGSGGGLLEEGLTRDTQRWAVKACYGERYGVPFDIQKSPKSDMSKASKKGKVKLHNMGRGAFLTIESSKETPQDFNSFKDDMRVLYENGNFYKDTFDNIVKRAKV